MKQELFDADGNSRGFYSPRNRVNDLTGKEWLYWTRSVIARAYPLDLQHALRRQHGGQKPPRLCADLIRVFTKAGQRILDPFMGVGGVLLGAELAGRLALGIELNPRWIEIYRQVCELEGLAPQEALPGDAATLLPQVPGPFDMVLTDVPYWRMDTARRSAGVFKRTGEQARARRPTRLGPFNDQPQQTKQEWLRTTAAILAQAAQMLRPDAYLVTFVGDMYADGQYHCLSAELAAELSRHPGLVWKANLVWYDVSKSLHVYGYQYAYIPSLIHQNVLVFRRSPQPVDS